MNAQKLRIRRAERSDAEAFLNLVDALADYEGMPRLEPETRRRLERDAFSAAPRFEVYLAELVDGEARTAPMVAGYVVVLETYSTFLAQPTLFLEDVFVQPALRRQGIGRALFTHCVQLAHERGCGRMEWIVLHWNQPALSFYHTVGAHRLADWLPFRLHHADFARLLGRQGP